MFRDWLNHFFPKEGNSPAESLASTNAGTELLHDTSSAKVWDLDASQYTLPAATGFASLALHPSTSDKNAITTHPIVPAQYHS